MRNALIQRLTYNGPIIAFLGVASLLSCALFFLAVIPQWFTYKERVERIEYYDAYISSSEEFDTIRLDLESQNELLRLKLRGVSAGISSRSLSDILQELINRGKECGVVLAKIQPLSEIKSADAEMISVFLETNADYAEIGRYVASLETLPQIIQIRKIAVETTSSGKLNAKLFVNCRITTKGDK